MDSKGGCWKVEGDDERMLRGCCKWKGMRVSEECEEVY